MGPTADEELRSRKKKPCIACKELIPADAIICSHCNSRQTPAQEKEFSLKLLLKWVGAITAVLGLITGLSGVVGPLKGWWTQGRQAKTMLATALKQEELGEYSAAFDTLTEILKNEPGNTQALHARLDVAMLWIEQTRVPHHDVDDFAPQAKALFDRLTPVLEAGLGGGKDYRAADVVAHLGWLNLLKARILGQSGIIDDHLRRALEMDPGNVYANAMMGEYLLLPPASLDEAKAHFATALKTGKAKTFVRGCQLEGMIYNESKGVRAELIRVANQMRKDNDPISDADRGRIHSYYSTTIGSDAELREVVSAVPPDESWATYQWAGAGDSDDAPSAFTLQERRFIQAQIDEVSGKKTEALEIYRDLQKETKDSNNRLSQRVRDAVRRLGP
jgi:tetratricopeptide (TPR) repeat protein